MNTTKPTKNYPPNRSNRHRLICLVIHMLLKQIQGQYRYPGWVQCILDAFMLAERSGAQKGPSWCVPIVVSHNVSLVEVLTLKDRDVLPHPCWNRCDYRVQQQMDGSTQSLLLLCHISVLAKSQSVGWDWSKICWFTCSEPNDKSLILTPALEIEGSIDLRARSQGHHGKMSMGNKLPNNTLMLMWITHRFTQATPRPHSTGGVSMCKKLAASAAPQTSAALAQHHRRRQSEGPYCHPRPALSAHHTLHMWSEPPPNPHHIGQHTQASQPSRWPYTNKQNVAGALFPPLLTRVSKQ